MAAYDGRLHCLGWMSGEEEAKEITQCERATIGAQYVYCTESRPGIFAKPILGEHP